MIIFTGSINMDMNIINEKFDAHSNLLRQIFIVSLLFPHVSNINISLCT